MYVTIRQRRTTHGWVNENNEIKIWNKCQKKSVLEQTNNTWYKIIDSNIKRLSSSVRIRCKYTKSLDSRIAITIDGNNFKVSGVLKKVPEKTLKKLPLILKMYSYKTLECTDILWLVWMGSFGCCRKCPDPILTRFADKAKTQ